MKVGIHTIFLPRENVTFLAEWIQHHLDLGIDRFHLYDNSGSIGRNGSTPTTNKYGFDFAAATADLSDSEVDHRINEIVEQHAPSCEIIPWQPKNQSGEIVYGQLESIRDCLSRFGGACDWIGFLDIDEFVFSPQEEPIRALLAERLEAGDGAVRILQKKFEDRFLNPGRPVRQITRCIEGIDTSSWAPKLFVRPDAVRSRIRNVHTIQVRGGVFQPEPERLRFNHYNVNPVQLRWARRFYKSPALNFNATDSSMCARIPSNQLD